MNPCMNMGAMMGKDPGKPKAKNPLVNLSPPLPLRFDSLKKKEEKTDQLRITAFNNIAAVYARQEKWDECKEKCTRV